MRICHLDPLFPPYHGGTEKVVYEVSRRLTDRHDITILTSGLPNTKAREKMGRLEVVRASPSLYFDKMPAIMPPPFTVVPFFNFSLMQQQADLFHIHNRFWYYYGTMATIKLLKRKKLALTLHNALPRGVSFGVDNGALAYDLLVGRRWMELANVIIAVSAYTRDVTVPKRMHSKVHVVNNGVDTKMFHPNNKNGRKTVRRKLGIADDAFVVVENARMVEQKGYPYLLEAFAMLKREHKNAVLLAIGKGPLQPDLEAMCRRLGIFSSVHFVTGIPEEELPRYYAAGDIFAHGAVWEPCAVVHPEAMASGLPVVAANIGGNPEQVRPDCGMLVEPHNPKALFEAMEHLYENPAERKKMGIAARKRCEKDFDWQIVADRWDHAYSSIE
jgi:glycosyltransferase involved in cell wall biosynthesis